MRLLLFGRLGDIAADLNGAAIPLDACALRDVVAWTRSRNELLFEALQGPGIRFAVDQMFVELDAPVAANSEVAFMSPLSGG